MFGDVTINEEDIKEAFDEYYEDLDCDEKCKEMIKDMEGGFLNWKNWEWESGLVIKKGMQGVRVCGDNNNVNEIHVISEEGNDDYCQVLEEDQSVGFVVENFYLPQGIDYSGNWATAGVERWLNAYGDPQYLLYYEQFPEGEEEYWKASSYNVAVGTILTVEGIFFVLDTIPFLGKITKIGLGKVFRIPIVSKALKKVLSVTINPIIKVVKGGMSKITPKFLLSLPGKIKKGMGALLDSLGGAGRILREMAEYPFRKIMLKELSEDVAQEAIERAAKETVENSIKRRVGKNAFAELAGETIEGAKKLYIRAFRNTRSFFSETGEEIFETGTSKLTTNAKSILDGEFDMLFKEVDISSAVESNVKAWGVKGYDTSTINSLRRNLENTLKEQNSVVKQLKNSLGDEGLDKVIYSMRNDLAEGVARSSLIAPTRYMVQKYQTAARASSRLNSIVTGDLTKEERQEIIEKRVKEGSTVLDNMDSREASKFIIHKDTKEIMERVFKEGDVVWDIGGKRFTAAEKEAAGKAFDEALEGLSITPKLKQAQLIKDAYSATANWLSPVQKKRHLVTIAAVMAAMKAESMQAKFTSSGTNAFGLKTPYLQVVDYDDEAANKIYSVKGKEDFFKNYGAPGYVGTIPEAEKYWMSLTRDKSWWWFDQDPVRFHLVSPCKADVLLRVSTCTCIGKPQEDTRGTSESWIGSLLEDEGVYETGTGNHYLSEKYHDIYPNGMVENFDGSNAMLFTVDEAGRPVKQCNPSGEWFTFGENEYRTRCIKFDPIMDSGLDQNYCYHGLNPLMSVANGVLNYGLPIGGSVGGVGICLASVALLPVAPLCGALGGAIGGVTGSLSYAYLNTAHQWPNHS